MLTIGQLAAYAGVTVRAVRHYHQVGLMPEPERDASGYRSYGAADVLRLVRVRTLAEAGVPLARVAQMLEADEAAFAEAAGQIDADLRRQIRELQEHRRRIAQLASGDSLAVPAQVSQYLALVSAVGAPEVVIEAERDAWILVAARYPEQIPAFMADKVAQLEDPRTVRFYLLLGRFLEAGEGEHEALVTEMADLLVELFDEAAATGQLDRQDLAMDDAAFVRLLDSMSEGNLIVTRLREVLAERGWTGWTHIERAPRPDLPAGTATRAPQGHSRLPE